MSQNTEKYLYFTVGLLRDSFALDALRRDALKHHMVDQPGQLIALRLTEYYELMAGGVFSGGGAASGRRAVMTSASFAESHGAGLVSDDEDLNISTDESIVAASPDAEQNADEAADYWARL